MSLLPAPPPPLPPPQAGSAGFGGQVNPSPALSPWRSVPLPTYQPVAMLGHVVQAGIGGVGAAAAVSLLAHHRELVLADDVHAHHPVTAARVAQADGLMHLASWSQNLLFLATAILFTVWFFQVHRNTRAMHALALDHSDGLAAGCFFIPLVNLVLPWRIAMESWRASDPATLPRDPSWKRGSVTWIVHAWWASYLGAGLVALVALFSLPHAPALGYDEFHALNVWAEVHCAAVLVSSVFAVRFVGALSRRQTQRATRLARFGWLPPGLAAGA